MNALLKLTGSVILATAAAMATTTASANPLFTQQFYSVNICGTFITNGNLSLTGTSNIALQGIGKLGLNVYGNGIKGELVPGGSVSGSLSMGGGASLTISHCLDVLKLVEVLENQTGVLTEAEQAMVNAAAQFDPDELKDVFVNVAYMTGLDPNRMLNLLTRIPGATEEIAGHLTSGDPVDALRTIDTLESLAQDMPMPPVVREALSDVHGPMADQLDKAVEFLFTMQDEICLQTYPEGLQEVIDELCRPLSDVAFAERLQDAILLIEDLFDVASDTAVVVGDSADTLDQVQDFLVNTVNVTINGIETGVNKIEDFAVDIWGFLDNTARNAFDDILDILGTIEEALDALGGDIGGIVDDAVDGFCGVFGC